MERGNEKEQQEEQEKLSELTRETKSVKTTDNTREMYNVPGEEHNVGRARARVAKGKNIGKSPFSLRGETREANR